jgi:ribonuclease E
LKDALRHDRARIQVGRISHFGLMEMSRQRIRTGVLESSTEICPSCGGTGHVRSVSSVALQLLRGIEDQLMKSASHDLVARAKPDVALYVLNNKRAHLRALEDQFGVMIMIQSDGSLTGQQSFVIERGGIARQKPVTAAPRISPDSVAVEIGNDDDDEAQESTSEAPFLNEVEDVPEPHHGHDGGGNGARRGGRRRRGRRGRSGGGEGHSREPMPAQNFDGGDNDETQAESSEGGFDAPQSPNETRGGESRGPDGEPRKRRRRGRRGGRRNRQDRNGRGEPAPQGMEAHQSGSDFEAEGMPDTAPAPSTSAPAIEHAPSPAEPVPDSSPSGESAAKRRSTVREPAPFVNFGSNDSASGGESSSASSRSESPSDSKGGGEIEGDRPRRSGWWSKLRGE